MPKFFLAFLLIAHPVHIDPPWALERVGNQLQTAQTKQDFGEYFTSYLEILLAWMVRKFRSS